MKGSNITYHIDGEIPAIPLDQLRELWKSAMPERIAARKGHLSLSKFKKKNDGIEKKI